MGQCTTNQTRELIPHLKKVNSKLQGESIKLFSDKESIIVERRKPVVEEMLKHLESSSITNCNTMIDAETGFGKTYDIGLWSHALAQAGYHHLVAVPNGNLVEQAKKMIDGAFTVDVKTPKTVQEIKDALKVTKPTTIIITHDLLLQQENDRKFEEQNGEKPKLWVSVDEADSINKQQAFENMCKLDAEYPTTYLTATPKKRILNRCGKIISPTRSSRRCISNTIKTVSVIAKTNERENFGRVLVVYTTIGIISYITLFATVSSSISAITGINGWLCSIVSLLIIDIVMSPVNWILLRIMGMKETEMVARLSASIYSAFDKSSPAHEYVEECEETFNYNKFVDTDDLLTSVRWNVHSPIEENALILANDTDSIVNLSFALQGKNDLVYKDDRECRRYLVYDTMFRAMGEILYQDYRFKLRQSNFINCVKKQHPNLTEEQISELKGKVDFSDTAKYLEYRVMHSMIDLTLSFLMGCDNIALDKRRKEDLGGLIKDVKSKVGASDDNSIVEFFKEKKGFSEHFARKELLPQIKTVINALEIDNDEQRRSIVDNWHLSKELHSLMEESNSLHNLNNFCERNKCIFTKFRKNNLKIDENKPFFAISYNDYGYEAQYCNYEESDINMLAKYALTTIIDESKGRGFDSEYNHIASIFTDSCSQFNDPAGALQNMGRNRERNPNRQPWFFAAAGEKVELFVDKVLAKSKSAPQAFCKKVLFPATDKYNKLLKKRMGVELGQKIETYISENMDALGNIGKAALKKFSDDWRKKVYEKVHDINDFDVKKTKKDLRKILESTEKYLYSYENRIKNNNKFSGMKKVFFSILCVIATILYYLRIGFNYLIFLAKVRNIDKSDDVNAKAYVHIIKNCYLESSIRAKATAEVVSSFAVEDLRASSSHLWTEDDKNKFAEKIISYLQSTQYIHALDKTIARIENEHLATILKAIVHTNKTAQEIKSFLHDLKNLSRVDFRAKYHSEILDNESNLYKTITVISEVTSEIAACHLWRHGEESSNPKLKTNHNIFKGTKKSTFGNLLFIAILSKVRHYDISTDTNELTLIKEQDKVKRINEVATDLSAISAQLIASEQQGFKHAPA